MKIFTILLLVISGLIISDINTIFIGISLLFLAIIIIFKKYRHDRKFLITGITLFTLFLIIGFIELQSFQDSSNFNGIVIKRSDGYFIVFDGIERIYVKSDDTNIGLFDFITINGNYYDLDFASIESEFDFKKYLQNQGINRQIYINSYTHKIKFNINCSIYKNMILSKLLTEKSKVFVNTLLLDDIDYGSELEIALSSNSILYLFSLSGLYLNYFSFKISNFLKNYMKEWKALTLSFIFLSPILFLNIESFIVKRMIVSYFVNFICLAIGYKDTFGKRSLSYLLLLVNKYNVNQFGFIMPLIISTIMSFSKLLFKRKKWYIKKFGNLLLLFLIVLPFTVEFNNSFNILTMVISFIFTPFIRFLLILIYPLVLLIKIPFLDNILDFTYDLFTNINIKYLDINVPPLNQYLFVLYYLILFILLYFLEIKFEKVYKPVSIIFSMLFLLYTVPIKNTFSNEVSFINVGQGDSTLIRVKNKTILVDTGGSLYKDIANDTLIPYLKKKRIYKLDAVFITHYDMDHYYALESLKANFRVKDIYDYTNFSNYDNEILQIYNFNNINYEKVEENSRSLVLGFSLGGKNFLLMGDAPSEIEKEIIKKYKKLDCDILKVGHHGSDTSSSLEFLKAVTPEEAIISCGVNNSYGHPSEEVVNRLNDLDIKIRRTDLEGTIEYML